MAKTTTTLSASDAAVLSALFDPEASLANASRNNSSGAATTAISIAPSPLPSHPRVSTMNEARMRDAVALVNCEAPSPGSLERALAILDRVISSESKEASSSAAAAASTEVLAEAFINRAQTRRLLLPWPQPQLQPPQRDRSGSAAAAAANSDDAHDNAKSDKDSGSKFSSSTIEGGIEAVLEDLSQAIRLLEPQPPPHGCSQAPNNKNDHDHHDQQQEQQQQQSQSAAAVVLSERAARGLANAYTHRGYIFYTLAREQEQDEEPDEEQDEKQEQEQAQAQMLLKEEEGARTQQRIIIIKEKREKIMMKKKEKKEKLESLASRDFHRGARYGNPLARKMSVAANPYAKLCGAIVRDALMREMQSATNTIS